MAKGNLFLGQAKGKVGSIVFSRAFGKQITRTKPNTVANPKTNAQNIQRAVLATIAKEAALLTPIVDHSFANVAYGAQSVRHFRKLNMGILRNMFLGGSSKMNLSAKGAGAVPNALKISEGNLPAFSSAYQDKAVTFYQNGALSGTTEISVSDFRRAYPYLQGGDQLTLVKVVKASGSLEDGDASFALKVDRIVFASDAFNDAESLMIGDDGYFDSAKFDLTKTTDAKMLNVINGAGGNGIGSGTASDKTYAAALILSRKVNNVWQRSTQYFEMTEIDDWTDIATAIDSYGAGSSLADATEYLNQAEDSTPETGIKGAYAAGAANANGSELYSAFCNAGEIQSPDAIDVPAGGNLNLSIQGFGTSDARLLSCSVQKASDGSVLASGIKSAGWRTTMSAEKAGLYWLIAVFADGTRAEFDITVALQA